MFVLSESTLQNIFQAVLQKISLLGSILINKNISMDVISIISLFLLECLWFTIYCYLNRFLYIYKIFQLTEQNMYVQVEIQCFVHTFYINVMDNSLGHIQKFPI